MSTFYDKGVYRGEIVDQALGKASTGNMQVILRFKVLSRVVGEDGEEQVPMQYERTSYMTITDKTIDRVVEQLRVLGYTRDSFRFIDKSQPNYHGLIGQQADFVCNHEPDQKAPGQFREKWNVRTPRESKPLEVKPLESKELRELDRLFGKHLKAGPKPPSEPQPAVAASEGVGFDDIPF